MSTVEPDNRETPPPAPAAAARGGIFSRRRSLKSPSEALQPEAAPPPPEPKKKKRRDGALSAFSGFLSFLVVLCVAGGVGLVLMQRKMREPGPLPNDKVVYVAPGTEVPDIIALLEKEGVIDNSALLNIELLVEGARSKLKAGEYLFRQNASLREVLDTLVNGRQILHAVTIPEGLTSQQIVERLRASDVLIGDLKDIPPEGSLLPETYKVARGTNVRDLVRKMQDSEKKLLARVWAQRNPDLPLRSPHEMLTLASIVEKETGKADERPRVAAVFINRLHKRMRLQSDPTIVYGLVGGRGTLGRGILASEVQKWTPYNT
ncbi:MAG: endolytic transglycosylase MltG, partial [Rhodoblastus sp.]|nr:endolytic transglycosylase MltG [Rhodoblastus sp.]